MQIMVTTRLHSRKKCLIFTIDGAGDNGINATISVGEKVK